MTISQQRQGNSTSTVLGRRLGGDLVQLRTSAGFTQGQAARTLSATTGKIAKMEGGWVPIRDPDIRALCELYNVDDPQVIGGLLELARVDRERRKAKGWWNDLPGLGDMREYVSLEHAATALRTWQLAYIPGLLQTQEYVRALRGAQDDDHVVKARLARQQRLDDERPLELDAVVYEAALRQLVGGPDVMRAQLHRLLTVMRKPHVTVRVLPFSAGALRGLDTAYTILSFAESGAMDIVYMDIPFSGLWTEGGNTAVQYADLFETISSRALDEPDSVSLIRRISEELG